jgi:glutamine synthetase
MLETSYDGSDPVRKFGGAQLVQQEPDASAFLMVVSEILLKEDIQLGIPLLQLLYMEPLYVFYRFHLLYGRRLDNKIPLLRALICMIITTEVCGHDKMLKKVTQL